MSVNNRRIANGCVMTAALAAALVCGPDAAQTRQESGRISGRVVLAGSSEPVADARVMLIVESNAPPGTPLPPPLQTSSGPDGRYVLDGIPPGRYGLSAMKPGFNTPNHALIRIQVAPGQTIADALIVIERTVVFAVSGRVLDPAGQPLPGAVVKVFQRAMMREGAVTVPTTAPPADANARGEYRIVGVPAGEYCVVAAYGAEPRGPRPSGPQPQTILAPTFFPGTRDIAAARLVSSASGEDVRGIDITMVSTPAFVVSGSVVTSDGAPLSGAAVVLIVWPTTIPARAMTGVPASRVGMAERWAVGVASGPDGAFSIAGIPPGTYRLTAASFRTVPLLLASVTRTVDASLTGLKLIASSAEPTGSPAAAPAAIKWSDVEELAFRPSEDVKVGQELEIIVWFRAYHLDVCHRTQVRVTAPDGTIYDPAAGAEQIGCTLDPPGRQFVRQYFWTARPGPASRPPWPTLPGKYAVTVEFREFIRGGEIRPGPPIVRTGEFIANR